MAKRNGGTRGLGGAAPNRVYSSVTENEMASFLTIQQFADMVRSDAYRRGRKIYAGTIQPEIRADYESKGLSLESNDVLIDDATIIKYIDHPKEAKGAVIDKKRYDEVAQVINNPTHIYEDTGSNDIVYVGTRNYSTGKVLKVVIHPNYKRKGSVYNLAKSIGVVYEREMTHPQYRQIK